ncbi:MAG TPA: hypothetical protein VMR86_15380 [Myxococcota bacterium]|nr:hypothetical protein [Myxococcota bacterium]
MSRFRIPLALLASVLCCASLASAAGFTEFEDRPTKDGDNSEDDPLTQAAPVPWNLQSFASAFPGRAKLIRGSLDAKDVDAYAFSLSSGQLLLAAVFETPAGEKNDSQLGVFAATGPATPLASDDDSGPGFFSRLAMPVTSTATQRIAVSGFGDSAWNGTHSEATGGLVPYTLVVAAPSNPPPFSESESNNTLATANALPAEAGVIGGSLAPNDVDYFKIDLEAGDRLALSVFDLKPGLFQVANGERNDAQLGVFTPSGALAAGGSNDDGGPGFQPNLLFTVPAGQGGSWKVALTGFGDGAFTGAHKESFSYLLVVARERACPSVVPLISGITTSTSKAYVTANLRGGDFYYIDRTTPGQHVLVDIPAAYECSQWIKTANDDKSVSANPHLSFTLSAPASVFVGFDTRSASEPPWLATGFTPTGEILDVADPDRTQEFRLERRDFAAGPVALGGNLPSSATSNYVVFAKPVDLTDTSHAFTIAGTPAVVSVTVGGVTLVVNRQTGQSNAQLASAVAGAINGNATLAGLRIFGFATGASFVTTGTLQNVTTQASPIPALPIAWVVALCGALAAAFALSLRRTPRDTGRAARSE